MRLDYQKQNSKNSRNFKRPKRRGRKVPNRENEVDGRNNVQNRKGYIQSRYRVHRNQNQLLGKTENKNFGSRIGRQHAHHIH